MKPVRRTIRDLGDETAAPIDALRQYLDGIGRHPLLTAEDEVALAEAIEAGNEAACRLAEIGEAGAVDRNELLARVAAGHAARTRFIEANLRLAFSIAKGYQQRGVPFLDLIQEANLGLMRAVEKFDHRRGFKFSTYATWWIRQGISRSIANDARTIRLPVHMHELVIRVRKAREGVVAAGEHEPTVEEIADAAGLPPEQVRLALGVVREPVSLHHALGDDGAEIGDFVEDPHATDAFESVLLGLLPAAVRDLLEPLTEREKAVVALRFGLGAGDPMTLDQVGLQFALTRERIRQIEAKALCKLRHPASREALDSISL